jgi:hypothetical protein
MMTFPKGLNDQKIYEFLSKFSDKSIFEENPEKRDEYSNRLLVGDVEKEKKEKSKQKKPFLQRVKNFLPGLIRAIKWFFN